MYTTRQNKVSRLIQKELSGIFQLYSRSHFEGRLISVTTVRISPDLSVARVYISIFPIEKRDEIYELVNEQARKLRLDLGMKVGKQLRIIPQLSFFIDDSLDYADNIDKLLK